MLAGRYEVTRELGRGGMGRVVAAHDAVLDRYVAIKLLSADADDVTRSRFVREARTAARLHHPNAVAVYDTGEDDGQPYLVMEYVRGRSLAQLLDADGPLDVEEAIAITLGVLDGLGAAHRAGMVHRDVKPANVLLPEDGGVKLSDFGIAKALDETGDELTVSGSLLGTPTYLAPELIAGDPPSPTSDVYSVGCLLYAQLTGGPPFTADEPVAVAYAHRHEPVPPVEQRRPEVPADLAAVVAGALAKDPAERYADAAAMRTALLEGPDAATPGGAAAAAAVAVPPAGAAPAAAGSGASGPDGTRVLDASQQPTRAVGAAVPAARPTAPPPGPAGPGAGGPARWPMVLLAAVAVGLVGLVLWLILVGDGAEAPPVDEAEIEEEPAPPADEAPPDEEPEDPVDEEDEQDGAADPVEDEPEDEPGDVDEEEDEQDGTVEPPAINDPVDDGPVEEHEE